MIEVFDLEAKNISPAYPLQGDDLNFIGVLALHQHRRDAAIGLLHVTTRQRGLIWYYNTLQDRRRKQLSEVLNKAFYLGVIKGARRRLRQIKRIVTTNTPLNEAQMLLQEAVTLQQEIDKAIEAING